MVKDDERREQGRNVRREAGRENARDVLNDREERRGDQHEQRKTAPVGPRFAKPDGGRNRHQREGDAPGGAGPRRGIALEKRRANPQKQAGRKKGLEQKEDGRQEPAHDGR